MIEFAAFFTLLYLLFVILWSLWEIAGRLEILIRDWQKANRLERDR